MTIFSATKLNVEDKGSVSTWRRDGVSLAGLGPRQGGPHILMLLRGLLHSGRPETAHRSLLPARFTVR